MRRTQSTALAILVTITGLLAGCADDARLNLPWMPKDEGIVISTDVINIAALRLQQEEFAIEAMNPSSDVRIYNGIRYEQVGVVLQVWNQEHTFLSKDTTNSPPHGPVGLIDEMGYNAPFQYQQSFTGASFLKPGVAVLRSNGLPYEPESAYEVVYMPPASMSQSETDLTYVQNMDDGPAGYRYKYRKTLTIDEEGRLTITYRLTNTGTRRIQTLQYNHNFFKFDNTPIGPSYRVEFPYNINFKGEPLRQSTVDGGTLQFTDIQDEQQAEIVGYQADIAENTILIANDSLDLEVRITGDQPIAKLELDVSVDYLSPKVYTQIDVLPGQTQIWNRTYDFIVVDEDEKKRRAEEAEEAAEAAAEAAAEVVN